ncbi:NADP-dependent oxidoreductase [Rhodopila sp.]|uniref:NADP-dependent oxidoreductase n=1 Tax=Rhodopila sp. TaxID=2480087 RepID=UPI003D13C779
MKAARIRRFGGPDVIEIENLPEPEPREGEIRVRIQAASVNPVDYKIRQGGFLPDDKLPMTLGRDISGVVDAAGPQASDFKIGDRVFAMLPPDRGGCAEFVTLEPGACAPKPDSVSDAEAASLGLAALTAWQGLFDHGGLRQGQRVLIHGGAGGVGHLAVQFARARGAEVYATCSGSDMVFVRSLGAAQVIDYKTERFEDRARDIDMVFDLIGGETQERSWSVLRRGGIMVSTLTEPDKAKAAAHGARGTRYMAQPNGGQLREIAGLTADGTVKVTIDRMLPLADIREAHRAVEHDHVRGKIAVRIA